MVLLLFVLWMFTFPAQAQQETVCWVHDGDKITLCSGRRVRIWGIDAPELKQPYGEAAREQMMALVDQKQVTLHCGVEKTYKRNVCRVLVGHEDVARVMARAGLVYNEPRFSYGIYEWDEAKAKQSGRGVWQLPDGGTRPWAFRKISTKF